MAELDLGRIKRNVGKMVDQGAPETEIDAYISGEGTSVDAVKAFKAGPKPDIGVDMAKGATYGFNEGIDNTLNMIAAPIRAPINYVSEKLGYGEAIPELQLARRANVAGPAETTAGRTAQAIGEVAGGSVAPTMGLLTAGRMMGAAAPGIISSYASAPARAVATDAVASAGAGTGISVARENQLGPTGELALGLAGGFLAPNALNVASQGAAAAKGTANYAGRMVARARNPQMSADQDTVDALLKAGVTPERLYQEFAPQPSSNLQGKGVNQQRMAEIISRAGQGEPVASLAKEIGIAPATLQGYLRDFKTMNPTPRGIADATQDIANVGGAQPVLRLGRAAYGIADDAEAAQAMTARQNDQYGRTVGIVNRAAGNRDYDGTIAKIEDALGTKSQKAYGEAHKNEQAFDLRPSIQAARQSAFESAGNIREGLEKATDLFFMPVMGADGKVAKLGEPITDVKRYQGAREALDDMIEAAKGEHGKHTNLSRRLSIFRRSVNETVRKANPLLAAADDQYSGAKSTQALLKRGEELNTRLGSKSDEFFKDYKSLNGEQREIIRLGFLRSLSNKAGNPRDGAGVANQFQSPAVRETILKLFSPDQAPKGATKAQLKDLAKRNREIVTLGRDLIKGMKQEATTTNTLNAVTGRGNSPSAPWLRDMEGMQAGAEIVGDVATLNWRGALMKTARKLSSQIGEEGAKRILANITETDPAKVLATIRRLAVQAKTTKERQAYVIALREFGKVGRRPASDVGTISAATQ